VIAAEVQHLSTTPPGRIADQLGPTRHFGARRLDQRRDIRGGFGGALRQPAPGSRKFKEGPTLPARRGVSLRQLAMV